ncbi:roadblock/LC7 domain-containing protein [Streptomyces sp. NBC_00859]|uniref:roadblock/LC7 domain-containing protein n=1 Tax=Streptomyces sp. NBC_00859 TaxID=2903682 RepID=UPI00386F9521|nr:roadblock/LC7 domain-containing protein [Streptomyces sp. NBC_00859]
MSSPNNAGSPTGSIDWILDDLVRTPHTRHALLTSADGLVVALSHATGKDRGDRTAAAVSGLQALSRTAAEFADCESEPLEQTLIQFSGGYFIIMAAERGSVLALSASKEADIAIVSDAMVNVIARLGRAMAVPERDSISTGS